MKLLRRIVRSPKADFGGQKPEARNLVGSTIAKCNIMWRPPYFVSIRKIYVVDCRGVAAISVSQVVSIRILEARDSRLGARRVCEVGIRCAVSVYIPIHTIL
jgi:hypothetical protein